MNKMFWFHIDMNDYRSGTHIYTYEKGPKICDENEINENENENENEDENEDEIEEEEVAPEEAVPYSFPLPIHQNYRIYIVSECPEYKIIGYLDADDEEECRDLYLKMFSQLHGCLPFLTTGYSTAYKEEGYYPEVSEKILKLPNIDIIEEMKQKLEEGDFVYFVFAINKNGDALFTEML